MKRQPIAIVLVVVLLFSSVMTLFLSARFFFSIKESEKVRAQYVQINSIRGAMQALATDAVEYSMRNPAIDPILMEFRLKNPRPGTNAPAKPAAQPTK